MKFGDFSTNIALLCSKNEGLTIFSRSNV
ncbi:MAG: hypothetical protein ACRCSG_00490 [Cellulosilyticaceae bacterium]